VYKDAELNRLMGAAVAGNQELRGAVARFDSARAGARVARSRFFPDINVVPSALHQRTSENMASPFPLRGLSYEGWNLNAPVDLSYEVDLWGRVRKAFEGAQAEAAGAAAAMESVRLAMQAELAQNYFRLRAIEGEQAVLDAVVGLWREELEIVKTRIRAGSGSEQDEEAALAELESAASQASGLAADRVQLENAIAVLAGVAAPEFRVAASAGMPSDLLERRPDIAQAERALEAATAKFGVASLALYPSLRIAGNGGFMGSDFGNLFETISRQWSIGPTVSLPLFAGGRNRAAQEAARAAHEGALAAYRQSVLTAFADVETQLGQAKLLAEQEASQSRAVKHAERAAEIAAARHRAGTVAYVEVLIANRTALVVKRAQQVLAGRRLIASVALVKALGGGWQQTMPVVVPEQTADPASLPPAKVPLLKRVFGRKGEVAR
jgi:multidrug efflux system outer membrane protein